MNCAFLSSFARDLRNIDSVPTLNRVQRAIAIVEAADDPSRIPHLEKLRGADDCYRIRVGDYRIGLTISAGTATFVRCLHRRDIYRYFT
ncbi:MAG: type II toxin-antitoxin system RelE family toxin [Planctomycetaceae bacterium]